MSLINIAICDDEKVQVELLEKYVNKWAKISNRKVCIEKYHRGDSFHILLLDIEMPGINGVELSRKIREEDDDLNIIFVTALSDYIAEGYDVSTINYLIKPIRQEKLYACLDKAVDKISKEERWILIEIDEDTVRVKESDILYIESFSHNIEVNTKDTKYNTRKNIGDMERELNEDMFVRCHRSYLVSLLHINTISKEKIQLDNGNIIPISRRRYKEVNMKFIKYFRGD